MPKSGLNVALKGLDDIFSTEESRQEEQREQVSSIFRTMTGTVSRFASSAACFRRCPEMIS